VQLELHRQTLLSRTSSIRVQSTRCESGIDRFIAGMLTPKMVPDSFWQVSRSG
jgi:hypothetical protein